MGKTSIEWTDWSVNPIRARDPATGKVGHYCEMISPGCAHCYASRMQPRFGLPEYAGCGRRTKDPPPPEPFLDEKVLTSVLRMRQPRRIFWCDMTDLFGDWVPDGWIMRCLDVMAQTSQHTHQVLTKRPERMLDFFRRWSALDGEDFTLKMARGPEAVRAAHPSGRGQLFASMLETMGEPPPGCAWPAFDWMEGMISWPDVFPQIWLGVSVENQQRADERIPLLLQTPAVVRFLSVEPLLSAVDLTHYLHPWSNGAQVNWVIVGGESGPRARGCDISWVRSLVSQCKMANVPCFVKQLGAWPVDRLDLSDPARINFDLDLRDPRGGDPEEWPLDLRVREFPR